MTQSADTKVLQLYHLDLEMGLKVGAAAADGLDAKINNEGNYQHVRNIVMDLSENRQCNIAT